MNILEVVQVSKFYEKHTALDQVSLSVPKGSIFGLLGPNGAGKTSLIRIITQITAADSGQVLFNGEKLLAKHIAQIGYLPEERGLYKKMKVGEQLIYLAQLKGMPLKEAKEKIKAWVRKFELVAWWDKNIEDLSKGMQQKVQFIATVVHQPELIILDEPFSGFDPINANLIKEEILELRKQGCTIIFSTHRMESVEELCDYIALINKSKKILEGKKMDIKNAEKQHIFSIETQEILDNSQKYHIIDAIPTLIGTHRQRVRILEGSPNEFLKEVLEKNQVVSFSEEIPSMNDIFIAKVGKA